MALVYNNLPSARMFDMSRNAALRHLKLVDPRLYEATKKQHQKLPLALAGKRTRAELFASLVETVISQQLGVAAADTIYARVVVACKGKLTSLSILNCSPEVLRSAGLSGAKIKTLKAIATAVEDGSLDLLALKKLPEHEAAEALMAIWGLGPWSAEMFLMFAVGRTDMFSTGDLGLVRAIEAIYKLPKNAPREKLLKISAPWAPWRTYACLLLWRFRDTKAD